MNLKNMWPFKKKPISWIETVKILNDITYRPGIALGWIHLSDGRFVLDIQANVKDTDLPTRDAIIRLQHIIPHNTKEQILEDVMKTLIGLETHEAREWFRYKGEKIFDPHKVPMDLINGVGP